MKGPEFTGGRLAAETGATALAVNAAGPPLCQGARQATATAWLPHQLSTLRRQGPALLQRPRVTGIAAYHWPHR